MVTYTEQKTLTTGWNNEAGQEYPVEGILLVGESVLSFESGHSQGGHYASSLAPAIHKGERAWLQKDVWQADYGYSACGTFESILSFEDGVKLLIEEGLFAFPLPK